jgi:hypothetical protein
MVYVRLLANGSNTLNVLWCLLAVVHPKDDAVFLFREKNAWCHIGTHVDDLFPVCNKEGVSLRQKVWDTLSSTLEINNLGVISWALQTSITRSPSGILKVSQEQFTLSLLKECGFSSAKGCETPAVENGAEAQMTDADQPITDEEKKELSQLPFQQRIGSFWWLAQISRPDIFFATHRVSKFQNKPSRKLWRWVERILKYLARFPSFGLTFSRPSSTTPLLEAYVDAAFATEERSLSRTGWCFCFLGAPVAWASENPGRVVSSSTEAECRGLVQLGKENVWMREFIQILGNFSVEGPTLVYEDNSSAISWRMAPQEKDLSTLASSGT